MSEEEVRIQLIWNEIHRKNKLLEKIDKELGFKFPRDIANEIIELLENKKDIDNLYNLINQKISNKGISNKNATKLKEYIKRKVY